MPHLGGRVCSPGGARLGGSNEGAHSNLAALLLQLQLLAQLCIRLARLNTYAVESVVLLLPVQSTHTGTTDLSRLRLPVDWDKSA